MELYPLIDVLTHDFPSSAEPLDTASKLIQEILILKPIKLGFTMNGNMRIKDEAKEREEEE